MNFLERAWYASPLWLYLLWPLSLLFRLLAAYRRRRQSASARRCGKQPVIVVGNITVGGAGKTSLLIALALELQKRGFRPGIISRGYGAANAGFPFSVQADSNPAHCGDEPVLIAANTGCPVVVDPDRRAALAHLLEQHEVDVVLSDDGLQHYRLHRDVEIAIVDGIRMFGNGLLLPAGPLREPRKRLNEVDLVVTNGAPSQPLELSAPMFQVEMEPHTLVNMVSGEERSFVGAPFHVGNTLQLVSGIGNPERFHELMRRLPYPVEAIIFPDHHRFSAEDFESDRIDLHQPIVMTEKDAVKCRRFATANFWVLRAGMTLPGELTDALLKRLAEVSA